VPVSVFYRVGRVSVDSLLTYFRIAARQNCSNTYS